MTDNKKNKEDTIKTDIRIQNYTTIEQRGRHTHEPMQQRTVEQAFDRMSLEKVTKYENMRCTATNVSKGPNQGKRCRVDRLEDSQYCQVHERMFARDISDKRNIRKTMICKTIGPCETCLSNGRGSDSEDGHDHGPIADPQMKYVNACVHTCPLCLGTEPTEQSTQTQSVRVSVEVTSTKKNPTTQ